MVDKGLRTTNRRVYAIGDVAGGAVHPRRQLSRRPRDPERAVPAAGQGERRRRSRGDLHRSGARPCRPDRRRRRATRHKSIRVLRWPYHENDRAQAERATHGHIKVVTDRERPHSRRDHRRRAGRRTDHHLDAGDRARAQYPRHGRHRGAVSDARGSRKTCGDQLFFARFDAVRGCGASSACCAASAELYER